MKKILKSSILTAAILGCSATGVMATPVINLFESAFNIDGEVKDISVMTGTLDAAYLGTLTWSTSVAGSHSFIAFFDYEIDEALNTFFNEYGSASGAPAAGQSWEIDEPGFVFGDIYQHVTSIGTLDETNGVPQGSEDDVSMAMGWAFSLSAGEMATITLTLSDAAPGSGFYLTQFDPDSDLGIYFSSNLTIRDGGDPAVPEPSTMLLMGAGLAGLFGVNRRKRKS